MGAWWQNLRLLHNSTLFLAEHLTHMLTSSYYRSSNLVLDFKTWEKGVGLTPLSGDCHGYTPPLLKKPKNFSINYLDWLIILRWRKCIKNNLAQKKGLIF